MTIRWVVSSTLSVKGRLDNGDDSNCHSTITVMKTIEPNLWICAGS